MGQEQHTRKPRKWKQISELERYKIEGLDRAGLSVNQIARQLGRDRRSIQREKRRGSVVQNVDWERKERYCADSGQRVHEERGANKGKGLTGAAQTDAERAWGIVSRTCSGSPFPAAIRFCLNK